MTALKIPKRRTPEKEIENMILSTLKRCGVFCFKVDSVGIYDQKLGRYRRKRGIHRMVGIADILGIYKGQFLAIEVKGEGGVLSPEQRVFLEEVNAQGGIGIVAYDVDYVIEKLNLPVRA